MIKTGKISSEYCINKDHLHRREQFIEYKSKVSTIIDLEKKTRVVRDNQFLLNRLVDIQKNYNVSKACSLSFLKHLSPTKMRPVVMPYEISVNYTGKKKEAERIDRENQLMIQRLIR